MSLLFVEAEDTYLVILRLDHGEDLRIFGSDVAFAEESRLGALLLGEVAEPVALAIDLDAAEPAESGTTAGVDPAGDADILADLGVPASALLALCEQEGMLPGDITAEVCQAIGCGDEVEELREA
jgi:putative tRNA adenosine deaminase-associated protein